MLDSIWKLTYKINQALKNQEWILIDTNITTSELQTTDPEYLL